MIPRAAQRRAARTDGAPALRARRFVLQPPPHARGTPSTSAAGGS
ncbi:hypothetical protein BURMUCF2_3166 [Burkholderia multivorans CF2]|nr:hypothetical protein BURMUCF2_3166 [Burkholderia multivorans CF2]